MHHESRSNHRCRAASSVARAIRVAIATLCLPVHGCDNVSGGAVELSWKLRPASSSLPDKFVACTAELGMTVNRVKITEEVEAIELDWRVQAGDAVHEGSARWPCVDNHGATGFYLPEGMADLSIRPICAGGSAAASNTYIAPATVQRDVIRGNTVSLGAVEIVISVSYCDSQPCICN